MYDVTNDIINMMKNNSDDVDFGEAKRYASMKLNIHDYNIFANGIRYGKLSNKNADEVMEIIKHGLSGSFEDAMKLYETVQYYADKIMSKEGLRFGDWEIFADYEEFIEVRNSVYDELAFRGVHCVGVVTNEISGWISYKPSNIGDYNEDFDEWYDDISNYYYSQLMDYAETDEEGMELLSEYYDVFKVLYYVNMAQFSTDILDKFTMDEKDIYSAYLYLFHGFRCDSDAVYQQAIRIRDYFYGDGILLFENLVANLPHWFVSIVVDYESWDNLVEDWIAASIEDYAMYNWAWSYDEF